MAVRSAPCATPANTFKNYRKRYINDQSGRSRLKCLLEAVEGKGPLMFAEIAMRKAVNAGKPAPEPTPRRRGSKR